MRTLIFVTLFCSSAFSADIAPSLHAKLQAANIPIEGVSVGKQSDRSTWRLDFKSTATAEQKQQAAQILAAFDPAVDVVERKTELQQVREEIEKLKAQMKEVAKTIPAVETVQAVQPTK